ncbi:unnamed protein product [Ilex paraguariensis]|uniref:Uncharacterized protein n=1 Tax=Ilex paraguariensis TaxID=185542 RepID=A0ABC8UPZ9_9AQUA
MMQTRFLQPSSWPFHNIINTTLDQTGFYGLNMDTLVVDDHEFSSLFTNTEDSSEISSDPNFQTTFSSDEYVQLPILDDDEMQVITYPGENFCHDMADFEPISSGAIEDVGIWLDERDGDEGYIPPELSNELDVWSPCLSVKSSEASVVLPSLILPRDDMEIDIQLGLHHLLKAYGEAMEMGQRELVKVLVRSINEKANPIGEALQRVTFNFFQSTENQGDYLKQESIKNFEAAFKAFYQMFPYGRFAHFTANSAILEAIPDDAEVIHIVDFDIGEGVQYPPMIEAIVQKQKTLRLTSIKSENVSNFARWKFEDTKKRLFDHARPFGLKLQVEETSMKDLVSEIKGSKGGEREWLAFNCMVGLPHMGRRRSMSHVMEFLKISKELLAYSAASKGVASVVLPSLILPRDDMEIDIQLGLHHLLKAYGEAMEMGQRELVKVLVRSINEKANPIGEALQRVTFNFFQSTENQGDYLKQESIKNFEAAFKAFYQMFPYGRFAHFTANSAILEAIPDDAEVIHIVDFDIGEGVQYPPMIEAIVQKQKTLRLTSIKSENVSNFARWKFEDTKKRLFDHARPFGLKLQVEETSMKDLVSEIKGSKGGEREWLAFNCMVGLPHMGRRRSMSHVMEFLKISKELLAYSAASKGVVTFGDGEAEERQRNCSEYGSFFDGHLRHYQALSESMEWNFPDYLTEARIAMESLFVAPYVCSSSWFHKWEETREGFDLQDGAGLQGWRLNKEMLTEAREIVKKGESSYEIRIEEQIENEMVLTWKGTPLVRVSTWM